MSGLAHPKAIARLLERIKVRRAKADTSTPEPLPQGTPGQVLVDFVDNNAESTPEDWEALEEVLREKFESGAE